MILQHVGGGGLLLQRLPQFVEQPRILDGDDGLRGEVLHQLDLLVGKRANFLAIDGDHADKFVVPEHRHQDERIVRRRAVAARPAIALGRMVGRVDHLLGSHGTVEQAAGCRLESIASALEKFSKSGRTIVHRTGVQHAVVMKIQRAELGVADTRGILQHGLENRLQIAGRLTDDAQHICRGRLLLQRLAQFVEQPRVLDGDDGLGGEVLYQRDLLVGEWADFLAVDGDGADQFIAPSASARR